MGAFARHCFQDLQGISVVYLCIKIKKLINYKLFWIGKVSFVALFFLVTKNLLAKPLKVGRMYFDPPFCVKSVKSVKSVTPVVENVKIVTLNVGN